MPQRLSILLSLTFIGCLPLKQPLTLVPITQPTAKVPNSPQKESPSFPIDENSFTLDNSPEVVAAMKRFNKTGKAPIIKRSGFVQYPFGEVQPILNCRPNYGCDIQLQAGEQIKAVIIGNEPMWDHLVWESNQQHEPVSHITIGPRTSNARTNAIIGTDRRTYHLELLSSNTVEYVRSAKFYYPRESLRMYQIRQKLKKSKEEKKKTLSSSRKRTKEQSSSPQLPYQVMSFGWTVSADWGATWKPKRVFDDGQHVYLQFPDHVSLEDLPGIYIPTEDGKLSKPVWRTVKPDPKRSREKGAYLMIDGLFDELQLIGGFSGSQKKVVIKKSQ